MVVTSFGSSDEPSGAGSTYLIVVKSSVIVVSSCYCKSVLNTGGKQPTFLLVDLRLDVEVDTRDDQIGHHIADTHAVQHGWVIKVDLLRHLHHHKDDDQVGTAAVSGISISLLPAIV